MIQKGSGAGTNFKVGEGTHKIVVVSLHLFGSTCTTSHFGGRFLDGQYILVLFATRCPPCPAMYKSGGYVSPTVPCGSGAAGKGIACCCNDIIVINDGIE